MLDILSYPRSFIGAIMFVFWTGICAVSMILCGFLNNRKLEDAIVVAWTKGTCKLFGVRVEIEGRENMPVGGCIYLFNHTSFFDIFAMNGYLNSFRFGAKIELFKIPVFGAGMRRAGILPIARDNREEVFRVYRAAEERIRKGERFALAPEGTRQSVEKLGKFKSGPFVFAINAHAPLVPVVVKGALSVWPKGALLPNTGQWSRTIKLIILPQVSTEGYTVDQRPILQEKVYKMMAPYLL